MANIIPEILTTTTQPHYELSSKFNGYPTYMMSRTLTEQLLLGLLHSSLCIKQLITYPTTQFPRKYVGLKPLKSRRYFCIRIELWVLPPS